MIYPAIGSAGDEPFRREVDLLDIQHVVQLKQVVKQDVPVFNEDRQQPTIEIRQRKQSSPHAACLTRTTERVSSSRSSNNFSVVRVETPQVFNILHEDLSTSQSFKPSRKDTPTGYFGWRRSIDLVYQSRGRCSGERTKVRGSLRRLKWDCWISCESSFRCGVVCWLARANIG